MLQRRAEHEENPIARAYYRLEGRRLQHYEAKVASQFAAHLACSGPDADRLRMIAPDAPRIEVIPNGVDMNYFRPSADPRASTPKSLVFIGGLSWYPNLSAVKLLCTGIWPLIPDADAVLTIIGRNPPDWLAALSRADPRIRVLGWVDDVRPWIGQSTVYVCPVFDGGGTRLKVLDALAMGIPMVAHPIACEGIEVKDGHHVLLAREPAEFVRKIRMLWEDPALRDKVSTAGIQLIRHRYSYGVIGAQVRGLYARLLAGQADSR
jgi:glycosyltransferase involved in cell wall biosynthesis